MVYLFADKNLDRELQGVTHIIKPGSKLDIVATNVLDEPVYASPAVYDSKMYLRGDKHLFCFSKPAGQ